MNIEKKQKKSIENEKQSENAENVSQRLLVKRKPLFFVEAISQLNEAQINSVKEIGFESVLHYKIEYIPSRLAFSLLKSFDEEKCKIKLYNGKKIHITEEDVELVYGFPRGNITYYREKWKSNAPFMRELAEQCDTKPGNVNHKAVEQLMLADKEGGPQFKRLFLVLLESALIEPSTCGMIKSKIGEIVDDLDNVRNINWCSYTISVLKFAIDNWSKTEKNAFAGPLPFLMLYYLDRVTQDTRPVPRTFPLMKGWKSEHLQAREDRETSEGVFGLGRIKKRYVRTLEPHEEEKQEVEVDEQMPQQQIPDDCAVGSSQNLLPKDFIQEEQQQGNEEKSVDVNESGVGSSSQNILPSHMVANLVKYIKQISDGRTNLVRVLKEASSQSKKNDLFGFICDIARSAIGSQKSPVASVSDTFLHLSQSYNINNDVAVDNWKAMFDSIRNAEKANETIEDLNEFPTFRLEDFFDKAVEQRNKDNLPTSTAGDPEEVRPFVEEDEQRKENMICDDHNESNSPILTAILGSPRTASPSLPQQEVNASEHDNTLASLIGSENRGSELTSPVGDPEEARPSVEEDKQRKENMICDDHNESNSPILTAILGSPRTSSPSLQQQEVNASEHDNTLASLIGSENRGSELEIQEDVEADRELRTQDALHILSKVCDDYEIRNNEEAIKATNTIVDIINEQEDREDAAACSIVEYMMQEGLETMDDTPPEWNVQKQGYKWIEKMHEEKEKTPENTERRMTVYQVFFPVFTSGYYYLVVFWMKINKIEIIDSVKPPKGKDPLENYSIEVGILKDMFEAYFKEKNISGLSENIKKSPYKVVPLDWATSTNKEDNGIYLMRHMETYFGRKGRECNIGFSPRGTKILQILRGRYCEAMLTSRSNKKCMDMVRVADDWMTANKHRLPELQKKFKEWFSCRNKK
ncbi:hypothetical protein SASPL_154447 [Salvia splendens]|uniref:Uncharacterized protein n=2 Tax=Salvia splendens TaxID=180675 RepID=A0A8X8W052_SALSN|nr:hypothetical protein SASPL_154447 [Salvia splendens]